MVLVVFIVVFIAHGGVLMNTWRLEGGVAA